MIRLFFIFTVISSLLVTVAAWSIEYESPRTLGLGGSGRANPLLNDAIYMNPSFGSFNPVYSLSGAYEPFSGGRDYNFSILDSRTELFQAGAGYTVRSVSGDSTLNLGASKSFQQLGFGIGSKMIFNTQPHTMTTDFTLGTTYIGLAWMYSTVVIDNLLNNLTRNFYLGFKFIPTKNVNIYIDPHYSPTYTSGNKLGYNVGVEFGLLADFFFRIGKYENGEIPYLNTRGSGFGLGAGWIGPKLNFDYALSRSLQTDNGVGFTTVNAFSMSVFF